MKAPALPRKRIGARTAGWGYGLHIHSTFPLPGLVATDTGPAVPDIDIVDGKSPEWTEIRSSGVYRVASPDLFDITIPNTARFTCLDRRRIVVDPVPHADRSHVADMLVATIVPALLWARGDIVLHAAAFLLPDASQAIAVAGASGSGKSTALSKALAIGAHQIADDSIRMHNRDGATMISGLAGGYFVSADRDGGRMFHGIPSSQSIMECRLGALVVLTSDIQGPRRLTGAEAIETLLRHRHRPRISTLLDGELPMLPLFAGCAATVPVIAMPVGASER